METQEKNNHLMKLSFSQSVMRIEQKLLMFSYGQFYIRLEMLRKWLLKYLGIQFKTE